MGQLQQFRTYMLDNRRQQLNVDLAAPVIFAEAYQGFIAQVALATNQVACPRRLGFLSRTHVCAACVCCPVQQSTIP